MKKKNLFCLLFFAATAIAGVWWTWKNFFAENN